MGLIQSSITKNVKRINFFVIICLLVSAIFLGCSAGSGPGPGDDDTPEMDVTWDGADVADGAVDYDLGTIQVDQTLEYTFTITNSGNLSLNFTGNPDKVVLTDGDPGNPPAITLPADIGDSLAGGANTSFDIQVDATGAVIGPYTASISIDNDDSDEAPYNFTVQVTVVAQGPEINVKQDSDNILSGTLYDFGDVQVGASPAVTFTIENLGMLELTLTGGPDLVSILDDVDNVFWLDTDAITPVAALGSTTFVISYTPTAAKTSTAKISIANDDGDENPYEFTISGNGTVDPPDLNGIIAGSFNTDQLFTITGIDPGSTAYYSLNNGVDWIEYTGEVTLSAEGTYQIVVKQIDAAMQESAVSSPSIDITIDKTNPDPPTGLDLAVADDTGDSAIDNITKNTSNLTISGSAEANADIDVSSDLDGLRGSTTADGSGNWSVDISLTENVHSITAVATDAVTNSSGDSVALGITVDTTPPATPSKPDLAAGDDTNIDNDDITSNSSDLTFTGTSDAGADITLESDLDGEVDTETADGGGNWTFDPISLSGGTRSITAKTSDVAGNEAVSIALTLIIDNTAPVIRTDKFSSTDKVVVVNATAASNYTTESGITATYDSVLKEVTLQDLAGNTTDVPNSVYQGAEAGGLREVITNAIDGDVIYVVEGTYTPSVNPVLINISASITIKGDGTSTVIDNADNRSVFVIAVDGKTVTFENLKLNNNSTKANQAMIKSGAVGGAVYLKNITEGTSVGDTVDAYLVMVSSSYAVYYWDSGTSGYKLAQNSVDDWTDNGTNWIFVGVPNTTCWTE